MASNAELRIEVVETSPRGAAAAAEAPEVSLVAKAAKDEVEVRVGGAARLRSIPRDERSVVITAYASPAAPDQPPTDVLASGTVAVESDGPAEVTLKTPAGEPFLVVKLNAQWAQDYTPYPASNHGLPYAFALVSALSVAACVVPIKMQVNLLLTSTATVYIGAVRSLRMLDHTHEESAGVETISKDDAYKFPIMGSVSLLTLYAAYKLLDKDMLNLVVLAYFCVLGTYTFMSTAAPWAAPLCGLGNDRKYGPVFTLPYIGEVDLRVTSAEIVCLPPAVALMATYAYTKHFLLNNLMGFCFSVHALEKLSVGSYKAAAILLAGLFVYDVVWVFGSDVMVTVGKSFDGPIKLLFPQSLEPLQLAMLGLGDIVIPGLFLSLLLRHDAREARVDPCLALTSAFPRPYFNAGVVAYFFGLATTLAVMLFFKAAQPALLYLVPACLLASLVVALTKGSGALSRLWLYDEEASMDKVKKD